jgi:hypothetical protein
MGSANLFCKSLAVNILGFAGYNDPVITIQLCHSRAEAAIDNL